MRILKLIFILVFSIFLFGCTKYENLDDLNHIKITIPKYENKIFHGVVKSSNSANLSFQTEGKITYFPFADGDFIKKGQTIAKLDGTLYEIRKKEETNRLKQYIIQENKQKSYYHRLDLLHKEGAISDNDWESAYYELKVLAEQIQTQKEKINYLNKELEYNKVTAPYDGYIAKKYQSLGAIAKIATPIAFFISSEGFLVDIMVDENTVNKLKINDSAKIKILDKNYQGNIAHIAKTDMNFSGYIVKVKIKNTTNYLKEGMSADVWFNFQNEEKLFIPIEYIFEENNQKYVYKISNIKENTGEIEKTKITTGKIINNDIEILNGLQNEDIIISNYNYQNLDHKKIKL